MSNNDSNRQRPRNADKEPPVCDDRQTQIVREEVKPLNSHVRHPLARQSGAGTFCDLCEATHHETSNAVTVKAVKTVVRMPSDSVMAKPLTGPEPSMNMTMPRNQRRQVGVDDGREGPIEPGFNGRNRRLVVAQLFADALVDQDVRVNRHADGEQDPGDTRQRQRRPKPAHDRKDHGNVDGHSDDRRRSRTDRKQRA